MLIILQPRIMCMYNIICINHVNINKKSYLKILLLYYGSKRLNDHKFNSWKLLFFISGDAYMCGS